MTRVPWTPTWVQKIPGLGNKNKHSKSRETGTAVSSSGNLPFLRHLMPIHLLCRLLPLTQIFK